MKTLLAGIAITAAAAATALAPFTMLTPAAAAPADPCAFALAGPGITLPGYQQCEADVAAGATPQAPPVSPVYPPGAYALPGPAGMPPPPAPGTGTAPPGCTGPSPLLCPPGMFPLG
jgi:hypothetical protein